MIIRDVDNCNSVSESVKTNKQYILNYVKHYDLSDDVLYVICSSNVATNYILYNQRDIRYSDFGSHVLEKIIRREDYVISNCITEIKNIFDM